ncbi:MAG: chorismate mutase [Solobacterium sp.]|nr:chorismate mutase [Solobacterium sp.]
MTRLDKDREMIDEIDRQLVELFEKRFAIVKDIIDYKIEKRMPILDSGREAEIVQKNCDRIENDDIRPYFKALYKYMISLSRDYQKEIVDEK